MRSSGLPTRIGTATALLLWLPCVGCWEEIHYQGPVEEAPSPEADAGSTASPSAEQTSPSVDELFADAPNGPPSVATNQRPVVVEPPAPVEPLVAAAPPAEAEPTAAERRAAWTLASNWSLVAAMQAKGLGPERYDRYLAAAREAGDFLGIAVPPLPAGGEPTTRLDTIIEELQAGAAPRLADALAARLDGQAGAAARLAIRAHLLLLAYTPAGSTVWSDAADIRQAGIASQLPSDLWRPVVELLERRADFVDVRKAVFELRQGVEAHLAE